MRVKKILVLPRIVVERIISSKKELSPWALISIYSSPKELLVTPEIEDKLKSINCLKVLSLCFGDFDKSHIAYLTQNNLKEESLFNENQARQILDFIEEECKDLRMIIIHCDAGVSRSGAVGLWACRYLNCDEKVFMNVNPHIFPNSHVYDTLSEISGMRDDYLKLWLDLKDPDQTTIF
jgi:predicted protein tyrosine phosphatase